MCYAKVPCIKGFKYQALKTRKYICNEFVGNKAKVRISKRLLLENKARQIFRKTNISYPQIDARDILNMKFRTNLVYPCRHLTVQIQQ